MKVEVINRSTREIIETYSVPDFYVGDFREWNDRSEVVIHLDHLLDTVENLDSKDPVTEEPISNPRVVDFYLPDPVKNQMLSRLAKSRTATEESSDQFRDGLNEVTERVSTPELKSSTILSAVVTEILHNHQPHADYKVRISDG